MQCAAKKVKSGQFRRIVRPTEASYLVGAEHPGFYPAERMQAARHSGNAAFADQPCRKPLGTGPPRWPRSRPVGRGAPLDQERTTASLWPAWAATLEGRPLRAEFKGHRVMSRSLCPCSPAVVMPGRHALPRLIAFKAKQTVRDACPRSRAAAQKAHLSWTMLPPLRPAR